MENNKPISRPWAIDIYADNKDILFDEYDEKISIDDLISDYVVYRLSDGRNDLINKHSGYRIKNIYI